MDRHNEQHVDLIQVRQDPVDGRLRIERQPNFHAERPQARDERAGLRYRLDVKGNRIRPMGGKRLHIAAGIGQHQMHVQKRVSGTVKVPGDIGAEGDVGYEMPIHDV